jgi:hypothetical protein
MGIDPKSFEKMLKECIEAMNSGVPPMKIDHSFIANAHRNFEVIDYLDYFGPRPAKKKDPAIRRPPLWDVED